MIGVFGIIIRTSVLLMCVSVVSLALRRASASVRHALWVVGLLAVLVFPVVSNLIPELDLAILPAITATTIFDTTPSPVAAPDVVAVFEGSEIEQSHDASALSSTVVPSRTPSASKWTSRWTGGQWLALLWALGSCVFVFGWMKSIWDLHRLTERSRLLTEDGWSERLSEVQREIGVSGNVGLRIGDDAIPPMTWGIFRRRGNCCVGRQVPTAVPSERGDLHGVPSPRVAVCFLNLFARRSTHDARTFRRSACWSVGRQRVRPER